MKNIIKTLFGILLLLLSLNSAYSWNFELGCLTNDDPLLDVNIIHYDEAGNFQSNFHLNEDNNAEYTITEGDILQFDFSDTYDEDNNIRSERIFWLNENRNDMTMYFQDNINVLTSIGQDDFSSSKFDFYNYLGTGISKPQYFQENTQSITYNDGNPQFHYVKTFKPTIGEYEVLFRITDDCADSDGSDEVYKFINVKVNEKVENVSETTYTSCNNIVDTTPNFTACVYGGTNWNTNNRFYTKYPNTYLYQVDRNTGMSNANLLPSTMTITDELTNNVLYTTSINSGQIEVPINPPLLLEMGRNYSIITTNNRCDIAYNPDKFPIDGTNLYIFYQGQKSFSIQDFRTYRAETCNLNYNSCQNGDLNVISQINDYIIDDSCNNINFLSGGTFNFNFNDISEGKEFGLNGISSETILNINSNNDNTFVFNPSSISYPVTINGNYNSFDITSYPRSVTLNNANGYYGLSDGSYQWYYGGVVNAEINQTYFRTNSLTNSNLNVIKDGSRAIMQSGTIENTLIDSVGNFKLWSYGGNIRFSKINNLKEYYSLSPVGSNSNYMNKFILQGGIIGLDIGDEFGGATFGVNVNDVIVGNAYLDQSGNDIFTCNSTLNDLYYNGILYKVCNEAVKVSNPSSPYNPLYDYIIVTDESAGGVPIPDFPSEPLPSEENQLPRAVLNIDNNEVEIGTTVCWDTTDSYDPDGTIVKKEVYVDNIKQSVSDSNCFTKNTPSIVPIRLYVEDNLGDSDMKQKNVAFTNTNATCDLNNPPSIVISYSQDINNLYYLNMTSTDLDNDTLKYSWSVNREVINGKDIYTSIDYSQIVYGTAFDGCEIGGDYVYVDTGNSETDPINGINVNLICSPQSLFTPTTVNCEVVYDLKGQTLDDITWLMDNTHYSENDGSSIFSRVIGDIEEHLIIVSVSTLDGQTKSDYYRFNLVVDTGGGGGGGGTTPPIEKDTCDIDIEPSSVTFDDDTSLVSIVITNNDAISWSPDYKFISVNGFDSVSSDLTITNEFGTIQADETKEIGIAYSGDIFSTEQVDAKNIMLLTSSNCKDIEIEINTDITNMNKIEEFIDTPLLNNLSLDNILETSLLSEELIGDNEFLGKVKVWQVALLVTLLITLILWKWKPVKSRNGSDKIVSNLIIKSLVILVLTSFITLVLVNLIRYIVGVL